MKHKLNHKNQINEQYQKNDIKNIAEPNKNCEISHIYN